MTSIPRRERTHSLLKTDNLTKYCELTSIENACTTDNKIVLGDSINLKDQEALETPYKERITDKTNRMLPSRPDTLSTHSFLVFYT